MSRSSEIRSQRYKAQRHREEQLRELEQYRQQRNNDDGEEEDEEDDYYSPIPRGGMVVPSSQAPPPLHNNVENVLPLNDHTESFNMVPILLTAIRNTHFYKQTRLKSFNELVDEIYLKVTHLSPYDVGSGLSQRPASPGFCLLLKAFEMKLTKTQMQTLLSHQDSPFIRALGGLYLRYLGKYDEMFEWLQPLLSDEEVFKPFLNKRETKVGEFIRTILTSMRYEDTLFPRIPLLIDKSIRAKLSAPPSMEGNKILNKGDLCRALYWEDGKWYDARVDGPGSQPGHFLVTFLPEDEYGNQEEVELKDIEVQETDSSSNKRVKVEDQAEISS